eukprot:TRINITY_DN6294_c0_g1_i6.p3 TRINITY_DN6294_c0_g1~~TRINITY_DN6294_c0_g1_i6.p3  ORF type:complete len:199 (-),score=9.07 TRINITY_DN6294_c0_g1_i6:1392-1988(-)
MDRNGNDLQAVYDIVAEGRGQPELILQRLIQTIKERPLPPTHGNIPQAISQGTTSNMMIGFDQGLRTGQSQHTIFSGQINDLGLCENIPSSFPWKLPPLLPPNLLTGNQPLSQGFMPYTSSSIRSLQQQQQQKPPQQKKIYKSAYPQIEQLHWTMSHPYYIAKYKAPKKTRSMKKRLRRSFKYSNNQQTSLKKTANQG